MTLFLTSRLKVRTLSENDLTEFTALQGDPDVLLYTGSKPQTPDESRKELEELCQVDPFRDAALRVWAVTLQESGEWIGTCAVLRMSDGTWDLGYRLLKKHWRKGYAAELFPGLLRFTFEKIGLEEVHAVADVLNTASIKVLEKHMKFTREFYNTELNCTDRAYKLQRDEFIQKST